MISPKDFAWIFGAGWLLGASFGFILALYFEQKRKTQQP